MTSHPSQDVATPLAVDQPAFDLPDGTEEPGGAAGAAGRSSSRGDNEHDGSSEHVPQYTAHQLPCNRPVGMQQDETQGEERGESGDRTNPEPELEITQSTSAAEQELQPELERTQNQSASYQEPQHMRNQTEAPTDTEPPTGGVDGEDEAQEQHEILDDSSSLCPPVPSSPVLSALKRAKQNQLSRSGKWADPQSSNTPQIPGRGGGRGRGRIPLQRSSSLPTSLLSPSRVVSSVRIQFGRGQASCTQPRYSFKYTQEARGDKEEEEEEEDEKEGQTTCLSTLIINPASLADSNNKPKLPTEAPIQPKPIPRYLMRSSYSLQSSSPPPDWSAGGHAQSWSTQSVPDLSSSQQQPGQFQQNMSANQNQQSWYPGQFPYPNPNPNHTAQPLNPSPSPSPSRNPSPYSFTLNPPPQYPSPLHPYGSLPNLLHHNPSLIHHSSLTSLHQPTTPSVPQHGSLLNLHQPPTSPAPHHVSLGNLHPGAPVMH